MTLATSIDDIVFRHLHHIPGGRSIGFSSNLRVEYFVDLLSAAHDAQDVERMAQVLREMIEGTEFDPLTGGVLTPKWGNVLLGKALAEQLGCPCGYMKADVLFGRWFEGPVTDTREWILVDDVASDGEPLDDLFSRAREEGVYLRNAFFLVDRTEGDARERLEALRLNVQAHLALDDRELKRIEVSQRASG